MLLDDYKLPPEEDKRIRDLLSGQHLIEKVITPVI
jgi:hypothetical protein